MDPSGVIATIVVNGKASDWRMASWQLTILKSSPCAMSAKGTPY